jgi:hypothetical protein
VSIKNVTIDDKVIAIIIRKDFSQPGVHFVTSNDFSQRLTYIKHSAEKVIQPHLHNQVHRDI